MLCLLLLKFVDMINGRDAGVHAHDRDARDRQGKLRRRDRDAHGLPR